MIRIAFILSDLHKNAISTPLLLFIIVVDFENLAIMIHRTQLIEIAMENVIIAKHVRFLRGGTNTEWANWTWTSEKMIYIVGKTILENTFCFQKILDCIFGFWLNCRWISYLSHSTIWRFLFDFRWWLQI